MATIYARRDSKAKIAMLEAKLRAAAQSSIAKEWAANDHNRAFHVEDGNRFVLPASDWQDMPTEPTTQWSEVFKR